MHINISSPKGYILFWTNLLYSWGTPSTGVCHKILSTETFQMQSNPSEILGHPYVFILKRVHPSDLNFNPKQIQRTN